MHEDVREAIDAVPDVSAWEGLGPQELERRAWTLDQIRRRIVEDGPRRAAPSPDRGRLFMPFVALEGYDEMLRHVERNAAYSESGHEDCSCALEDIESSLVEMGEQDADSREVDRAGFPTPS